MVAGWLRPWQEFFIPVKHRVFGGGRARRHGDMDPEDSQKGQSAHAAEISKMKGLAHGITL